MRPAILLACAVLLAAAEPQPVAVGAGSYAPEPPKADAKLQRFLAEAGRFDPAVPAGTPVPSNDWCSQPFFHEEFGRLWAYPLVVSADGAGALVHLPLPEGDGTRFELGPALAVRALPAVRPPPPVPVAVWTPGAWPAGWSAEGTAFGPGPAAAAEPGQMRIEGVRGAVANSFHGGDRATGTLTSPPFAVSAGHLHVQVAGGRDLAKLRVELVVDGKAVLSAAGENGPRLRWVSWDVSAWKGRQARLRAVDASSGGWGHIMLGDALLSGDARDPDAAMAVFPAGAARPLRWGDWTATFRLRAGDQGWIDLTCGRGLPFAWVEADRLGLAVPAAGATVAGLDGRPLPAAGAPGALVVRGERRFAVYAGGAGRLVPDADGLRLEAGTGPAALAVGALPPEADAQAWRAHALAIPRDSRFAWTVDRAAGRVDTTWTLATEALGPGAGEPLTGWLPHHWRQAMGATRFQPGTFATPRGRLRLAAGGVQRMAWRTTGLVPGMPAPEAGGEPAFDAAREEGWLAGALRAGATYRADTYWGGKDVLMRAQLALIARLAGSPQAAASASAARTALADWFTWTPGEEQPQAARGSAGGAVRGRAAPGADTTPGTAGAGAGAAGAPADGGRGRGKDERYFVRYERSGALVGFKPSYGSEHFTDNHFHYGYFTLASAMLAAVDPSFARDFGGMATLVAKQYANWDRDDRRFPFLRTFDPWAGHSHAGGSSSPDGNNQESSSEAMQSWGGLALLGAALGDQGMADCGAMGYAIEGEATREYWNDYYGWKDPAAANWPKAYGHAIVGILGDSGNAFATFFNGEPRFVYGIQWLPISPAMAYLGADPAFGLRQWGEMVREQRERKKDPAFELESLDAGWGMPALGYLALNDPVAAARRFEALSAAHHRMLEDPQHSAVTYWLLHAYRAAGTLDMQAWTGCATACVLRRADGARSLVAWNPGAAPLEVVARTAAGELGRATVAPGAIVRQRLGGR